MGMRKQHFPNGKRKKVDTIYWPKINVSSLWCKSDMLVLGPMCFTYKEAKNVTLIHSWHKMVCLLLKIRELPAGKILHNLAKIAPCRV